MHPIHALWCHPRSVSTAFERVMRERGDLDVPHEPFMYFHYLGKERRRFPGFEPDPEHPTGYGGIRDMILARAAHRPVFFKDMAYYVLAELPGDPGFAGAMSHTFLVRDPAEAAVSYAGLDPGFAREELGIEAQWRLREALIAAGLSARVILTRDLRADPAGAMARYWASVGLPHRPEALTWDATVPEEWKPVKSWHADAIASGAIRAPDPPGAALARLEALGEPWLGHYRHHLAFYEKLAASAGYS